MSWPGICGGDTWGSLLDPESVTFDQTFTFLHFCSFCDFFVLLHDIFIALTNIVFTCAVAKHVKSQTERYFLARSGDHSWTRDLEHRCLERFLRVRKRVSQARSHKNSREFTIFWKLTLGWENRFFFSFMGWAPFRGLQTYGLADSDHF